MDIAEMKITSRAKGSAKVDTAKVHGEALAATIVAWAWNQVAEEEKRSGKLAMFVQDICALEPEAHTVFRMSLKSELDSIAELEKVSGVQESKKAGYSLNSFRVMVSNWRAISEAASIGFTGKDKKGQPMPWTMALETAREYRKTHVSADGTTVQRTAAGKTLGAGRKALTDYDKAIRVLQKLNLRDLRKVQAYVNLMIQQAETGKPKHRAIEQAPAVH